jgi:hypothetical protein
MDGQGSFGRKVRMEKWVIKVEDEVEVEGLREEEEVDDIVGVAVNVGGGDDDVLVADDVVSCARC